MVYSPEFRQQCNCAHHARMRREKLRARIILIADWAIVLAVAVLAVGVTR